MTDRSNADKELPMSQGSYDAIVVGARCAGSPTAMLLARRGWRVLLLDRAAFPSDTVSTHMVHPLASAALARWGLLERVQASGCPAIDTYAFDFGPFMIAGAPGTKDAPLAFCPRRTVLDKLLRDAAAEAGVEVREGFDVEKVSIEDGRVVGVRGSAGGKRERELARIVIGADGRASVVAGAVDAPRYNERTPLLAIYYAYWSGVPMRGRFETYIRDRCGFAAAETNDGLTMIVAGWPTEAFANMKGDIESGFAKALDQAPGFAERVRAGKRETRFAGAVTPNFFRKPYGPGWALVGDAGYLKDPITAQGILDAFRDAELCARAADEALGGRRPFEAAMADYQSARDAAALPMYDFTYMLAALEPPPPDLARLLGAIHGNPWAMDAFARVNAGTMSPAAFFAPEHVDAMLKAGQG
jgi:2-polyprenyl-6-methoxyphenol hydroxylase-like FAD-dependent oxidoreductase